MATRNQRLALVRLGLHDFACTSGGDCYDRPGHATRTQHTNARRVVDGTFTDLLDVVHETCHPRCELNGEQLTGHIRTDAPVLLELASLAGLAPTSTRPAGDTVPTVAPSPTTERSIR